MFFASVWLRGLDSVPGPAMPVDCPGRRSRETRFFRAISLAGWSNDFW